MGLYTHTHTHTHTRSFIKKEKNRKGWNINQSYDPLDSRNANTNGITLVALVVTIVVLLILAGITITYVMGDNSIFNQATKSKTHTEIAKIEEQAQTIYADKLLEKAQINKNLTEKPTMQEVVAELNGRGYTIEQVATSGVEITGIELSKTSMDLGLGETATIEVKLKANGEPYTNYLKLEDKYYKIDLNGGAITIAREESDISEADIPTRPTLVATSGNTALATVEADTNALKATVTATQTAGTTEITIKYGDYKEEKCTVNVVEQESKWDEIAKIADAIANSPDSEIGYNDTTGELTGSKVTIDETTKKATVTVKVDGVNKTISTGDIYKVKYSNEILDVRVLGFKHDTLASNPSKKAGISFEFVECLGTHAMNSKTETNPKGTNAGGWAASEMRTYLNSTAETDYAMNQFSATFKKNLKEVTKSYIATYNKENSVTPCNDKLWLLACSEIVPQHSDTSRGYKYAKAITSEGNQYQYYKGVTDAWDTISSGRMKTNGGSTTHWWLRSPYYDDSTYFCLVINDGEVSTQLDSFYSRGVAPGFAI